MHNVPLIRVVLEALKPQGESGARRIVRFRTRGAFVRFYRELRTLQSSSPDLAQIRTLVSVHGIVCPLPSDFPIIRHPDILDVEPDVPSAYVHTPRVSPLPEGRDADPPSGRAPHVPWSVSRIGAPKAWKKSTGRRIRIAVIDTGIDFSQPDLRSSVVGGINLIFPGMPPWDDNGHGTHIAGTIAASRPAGILGVAPEAELYAVKAFDSTGTAYVSDIIAAIDWCLINRIDVLNMSFGMKSYSPALEEAVRSAYEAGKIVVASSGNGGGLIDYPARFPFTVSVGATTRDGRIAPFSGTGKRVDIYAPGEDVYSTWPYGKYHLLSGTSMATSHVTGVVALMLSRKPNLTLAQIKKVLRETAGRLRTKKGRAVLSGEVNAARALFRLARSAMRRQKSLDRGRIRTGRPDRGLDQASRADSGRKQKAPARRKRSIAPSSGTKAVKAAKAVANRFSHPS